MLQLAGAVAAWGWRNMGAAAARDGRRFMSPAAKLGDRAAEHSVRLPLHSNFEMLQARRAVAAWRWRRMRAGTVIAFRRFMLSVAKPRDHASALRQGALVFQFSKETNRGRKRGGYIKPGDKLHRRGEGGVGVLSNIRRPSVSSQISDADLAGEHTNASGGEMEDVEVVHQQDKRARSIYHVFLSFRGCDVRKGFVDHLYQALTRAGFRVFLDTHSLKRGDDIYAALETAIESQGIGSAIAITCFIKVRRPKQRGGPFATAFEKHESSGRYSAKEICEWKVALFELCRPSGWSLQEDFNGYEAALVNSVVDDVAQLCNTAHSRSPSI